MWIKNQDTNQWTTNSDSLRTTDFESLKQDLKSLRFYQKVLSGALFASMNDTDNIYDILTRQRPKTWNYKWNFSQYVKPYFQPVQDEEQIVSKSNQFDFLNKHLLEYGQTLKNLFTPTRLIKDQITNLLYVDLTTTESIDNLTGYKPNLVIDSILVKEGHLVLVKNQISTVTLPETTDPETYFTSFYDSISTVGSDITYYYYNNTNGIYKYTSGKLVRTNNIDEYDKLINFTVSVKLGTNTEKQFTLQRLKNGYFPVYTNGESMFFTEKKNYVLRSRMDYNNLFELVLYDTLKHGTQSFQEGEITYSIPERTITVGEFGSIILHQEDYSNFITNKYKTNIRSIDENEKYYWACGDDGIVLKISKIDLSIERIFLEESIISEDPTQDRKSRVVTTLNSISFFNNLVGVVVGKFNQIWNTKDGGKNWQRIYITDFDAYNFNTTLYQSINRFYVGGDNGVFIDFVFENESWTAFKRRISQFKAPDDEYLLVDDIKDLEYFTDNSGYFAGTASFIAIAAENGNLFLYDIDSRINELRDVEYDFYYVGGTATYSNNCGACSVIDSWIDNQFGDISSVTFQPIEIFGGYLNSKLLFSTFESVYQVLPFIGTFSSTTSNILAVECLNYYTQSGVNQVFSYKDETIICGINSLWKSMVETVTIKSNNPDVYAIIDSTSILEVDALNAGASLEFWFQDFCKKYPTYTGSLYVLPSIARRPGVSYTFPVGSVSPEERWLDLPRQILSLSSAGTGNFFCITGAGTSLPSSYLPYRVSFTQSLVLEREVGTMSEYLSTNTFYSFIGDPQTNFDRTFATWSRPTDMILLSFFDESERNDYNYHAASPQLWGTFSNPNSIYEDDFYDFTQQVSPVTGATQTALKSFVGILYPILKGDFTSPGNNYLTNVLNSSGAALVIQGVSAIYGSTLSVAQIEEIPGLSTDTTSDYPGEPFSLITNNDTSGYTDGWDRINAQILTTYNPYIGLVDVDGFSGLQRHGWEIVCDKRKYDVNTLEQLEVFEPIEFGNDLNKLLSLEISSVESSNVYHQEFFKELKPRLLFMDYDAGSKVYWFDDYGQYRLPERLFIPVSYLVDSTASTQSFIQFKENTNYIYDGNTGLTTSYFETNWITYWQDRSKTFEYYTHLDDAYKVLPSFTFESSNNLSGIFTYSASGITTNKTHISNLMPAIDTSRYRDTGITITAPLSLFDLYFYDFLGIWRIVVPSSSTSPKKGDVIEIICPVFSGKFLINKVFSTISGGNTTYYQYFYTNFNGNILTNLSQFSGILEIKNLNKYATTTGGVKSFTSTYATSGYSQGSYKNFSGDKKSSFDIEVNGAGVISSIKVNQSGFGFNIGDTITLASGGDFGGTTDIIITITDIDYNSEFISNFKNHYINYAYDIEVVDKYIPSPTASPIGLTQSFQVTGKYTQYSAYYNLQSNVEVLTTQNYLVEEDIRYQSTFLDFGYSPTYNLISYLNFLDNKKYTPGKEFLSLPCYEDMPGPDSGIPDSNIQNDNLVYLDFVYGTYSGMVETNKIYFGSKFEHIWKSFMKWTFVDIILKEGGYPPPVGALEHRTDRLLIIDKYFDGTYYVMVLHDKFAGNNNITSVSILSRRSLQQISDDLQYINRIQRPNWKEITIEAGFSYTNYETDIGYKISTDSYTKALLSDSDIIKDLSAVIYTDYKFELAIQIVKLENEFDLIPSNVSSSPNSKYKFSFPTEHNLKNGEGVTVKISATASNYPNILGYHSARKIDNYSIEIDVNWSGFSQVNPISIYFIKQDPFLNYQPVDIFDIGVGDKKVKQSIEILPENYDIINNKYQLINLDFSKYRFRLIDGLDLTTLTENFYWILDAEVSDATIGLDSSGGLVWYKGIWEGGRWFGGTWISGTWKSGDWYYGKWTSKNIFDKKIQVKVDPNLTNQSSSKWFGGRWFDGTWENGTWYSGRWYGGTWQNGRWFDGTWNDGTWQNGKFTGGIWVRGSWKDGIFNTDSRRSFWLDGVWDSGDFENGIWYNGQFNSSKQPISRFGTKSTNTRNAIWHAGRFLNGEFHSFLNLNDSGLPDVSTRHKYSTWYTGTFNGVFYGGNAYNITFNNSTWKGGILNDISIIRIDTSTNSFTLDGIYRFNLNDKFYVMDDVTNGIYSVFGSTENTKLYQILDTTIDEVNKRTEVVVDLLLSDIYGFTLDTGIIDTNLKCVSVFKNSTWNSGIWSNGLFEDGKFYGGLWYNGNFSGIWG